MTALAFASNDPGRLVDVSERYTVPVMRNRMRGYSSETASALRTLDQAVIGHSSRGRDTQSRRYVTTATSPPPSGHEGLCHPLVSRQAYTS